VLLKLLERCSSVEIWSVGVASAVDTSLNPSDDSSGAILRDNWVISPSHVLLTPTSFADDDALRSGMSGARTCLERYGSCLSWNAHVRIKRLAKDKMVVYKIYINKAIATAC
jgi:hypothetical protein